MYAGLGALFSTVGGLAGAAIGGAAATAGCGGTYATAGATL